MEQELDLRELFQIIRKRMYWLIIIPIIALVASGLISFFVLTPIYEASTTLLVGRELGQDRAIVYDDIRLARQLVDTYAEIAKSRTVASAVIDALRLDMTAPDLIRTITISPVRNTEVMAISVRNPDPELAAQIANQVAVSFTDKALGYAKIENVMVIDEAVVPSSPVSPNIRLNIAIAGVLGVMVALGLIFLLEFLDNTIKTPADVEKLLGLSVIAAIPKDEKAGGNR